jgi:hypothetical protein
VTVRIGERLVGAKVVTRDQVERALHKQALTGGRLGTILVLEAGLDLDLLAEHLAAQVGVPVATASAFEQTDPAAVAALGAAMAGRRQAVPLSRLHAGAVAVAFVDPRDPEALDEVAHALGAAVIPFIAPELRILYQLERRYGIPRPNRLLRREHPEASPPPSPSPWPSSSSPALPRERRRYLAYGPPVEADEPKPLARIGVKRAATPPPLAPQDDDIPIDVDARRREPSPPAAAALRRIAAATARPEVSDALVGYLRETGGCGVVFVVRDETAVGWKGVAPAGAEAIQGLAVPLSAATALKIAHDARTIFHGPPPASAGGFHQRIAQWLGATTPRQLVVAPLCADEGVIGLVYAHADGDGEQLAADLEAICSAVAGYRDRQG